MQTHPSWLAYVGSRTTRERNAHGRGLSVFRSDGAGAWKLAQVVEGLANPSFLCLHPHRPRLYAVHGDFSEITTFAIDHGGLLTQRTQQSTRGNNPVHLALNPSSRWLLVANYASGNVVSIAVDDQGDLGSVHGVLTLPGAPGPHPQQKGSHPHQVCFTPDGRHAMVPDKGLDRVFTLKVDETSGRLTLAGVLATPPGSGPRHLAFHPEQSLAYLVGELDRTVMCLRVDIEHGALAIQDVRSSVPAGIAHGSGAGIVLSPDARRLYVSNRGHNSIAMFDVGTEGKLGQPSWLPAGETPRFITQLPNGGPLVVAREDGHSIAALEGAGWVDVAHTGSPVCIVVREQRP